MRGRLVMKSLAFLMLLVAMLLPASPVRAHTDVDEYTPATGEILDITPEYITLRFSNPPNEKTIEVRLAHRDGREVPFTGGEPILEGNSVTVRPPALDTGTYVIIWESTGADGHTAAGQSYFSVGVEEAGGIVDFTPRTSTGSGTVTTILDGGTRFSIYALLALLVGLWWLTSSGLAAGNGRARDLARGSAALLLVALVIRALLVGSRAGGAEGLVYGVGRVLTTTPGVYGWVLMFLGAGLLLARPTGRLVLPVLLGIGVGEVLSGHIATARNAALLVPATSVHLLAAALWGGCLLAALIAGDRASGYGTFARKFTPWALASFTAIAVSGVVLTAARTKVGGIGDIVTFLDYRYGQLLTGKWLLLLLLIAPLGGYHMVRSILPALRSLIAREKGSTAPEETSRWNRPGTLTLEAAGLVVVLVLGSLLAGQSPTPPSEQTLAGANDLLATPSTFQECIEPSEPTDQLLCATRYFEGIVSSRGMNAALQEVSQRWREGDPWMQSNCHSIGHKLGRLGFRIYQDIPKAFEAGSDPCDYGYLHGVIEGASADFSDDDLKAAMTTLCEGTGDVSNHGYRQCIHGLGHAAARRVNNDLRRGMDFCLAYEPSPVGSGKETINDYLFRLCVTGVSMEWNTQPQARNAMTLPIGAEGTLLRECLNLDEVFYPGCIEYGTSAMGGKLEREIAARDWCDANLEDPLPCYQSIGRDVIWSEDITPEQAMEVCTGGQGGIYAEQCITRALGSVITIALDVDAVDEFCPVVPSEYRYLCGQVKEAMRDQIRQTLSGFIIENSDS